MDDKLEEKINISLVDPSDLEWFKQQKIWEIAGVISFGDSKEFQKLIDDDIPVIFSHSGYWTDEWRYVDSTEQWPLQLFSIQNTSTLSRWDFNDIKYTETWDYLIGSIEVQEPENSNGNILSNITEKIYDDIYYLMQKTNKNKLLRIGNYITDILAETTMDVNWKIISTNRYKAFCTGRSLSLDNTYGIKETKDMPTATGIWNHFVKRYVKIFFIATNRQDVAHHKNPKQTNPADYSAQQHGILDLPWQISLPKFSRSTTLAKYNMLFVGGTASILWQEVVHEWNVTKQTIQALQNIKYTMEEAEHQTWLKYQNLPIILKVFVKNKNDFDAIKMVIESKEHNPLDNIIVDTVYTHGDVCRDQWLVEISCETMDYETAGLILTHKWEKKQKDERKILHKLFQLGYNWE